MDFNFKDFNSVPFLPPHFHCVIRYFWKTVNTIIFLVLICVTVTRNISVSRCLGLHICLLHIIRIVEASFFSRYLPYLFRKVNYICRIYRGLYYVPLQGPLYSTILLKCRLYTKNSKIMWIPIFKIIICTKSVYVGNNIRNFLAYVN